jgi:putative two-component system response regulator
MTTSMTAAMTAAAPAFEPIAISPVPAILPTLLLLGSSHAQRRELADLLTADGDSNHSLGYRFLHAAHVADALEVVQADHVHLILILPTQDEFAFRLVLEFCRWMKAHSERHMVPVLALSAALSPRTSFSRNQEADLFEAGADQVAAPALDSGLTARVRSMLRQMSRQESRQKGISDTLGHSEAVIFSLAEAVEQRDPQTSRHCQRLATFSVEMAKALGLSETDQLALYRGGFLHDIGKVSVPDAILFKKGPLNPAEWNIIHQHTVRGEEICRPLPLLSDVLPIIRSHHERWDGSGYPDGLRGEEIPLLARILQIVDVYDALTTQRPYKPAYTHAESMEILWHETRLGWYDPRLVSALEQLAPKLISHGIPEGHVASHAATHESLRNLAFGLDQ